MSSCVRLSVRLSARLAQSGIVPKWLVDFFSGHTHCTRFHGSTFGQFDISFLSQCIQGSAIGPASCVVNAADLTTVWLLLKIWQVCQWYLYCDPSYWACSEIRSRVFRSATVPFFYHKTNDTVALRSTSKHSGAYFRTRPLMPTPDRQKSAKLQFCLVVATLFF